MFIPLGGIRSSGRKKRLHSELGRECSASRCCATVAVKFAAMQVFRPTTLYQSCCVKAANPHSRDSRPMHVGSFRRPTKVAEAVLGMWVSQTGSGWASGCKRSVWGSAEASCEQSLRTN